MTIFYRTFLAFSAIAALCAATFPAYSLPRFALLSGQGCASCHVSMSGGGMRNEGGWSVSKTMSLIDPEGTFLSPLYSAESNTLFTPMLSWGFDFRTQIAKRPSEEDRTKLERDVFMMQLAPYLSFRPTEELEITAQYNFVEPLFPGQQRVTAYVTYRPMEQLGIKAGYIEPMFGVRHDDHTIYTRTSIGMWPYYVEPGAEVHYAATEWLAVAGGGYLAQYRKEVSPIVEENAVIGAAKITLHNPESGDINYSLGGSAFVVDGETIFGGHAGIGLTDHATLLFEYVQQEVDEEEGSTRKVEAFVLMASYQILDGLAAEGRYEERKIAGAVTKSYVLGLQIFVLPYLELRPEYRWSDSPTLKLAQYTGQIHVFY